jgi:hypothetical protein
VTDFQRFGKTNMDFAALQQKLFDLDPSDRAEDLRKLSESVGGAAQESVQTEENFLQESVEIAEGTMPVEGDYSLSDFAALAGVTLNEGLAGDVKAAGIQGYKNYNTPAALSKSFSGVKSNKATAVTKAPNAKAGDWKGFLKQHTAQLQKIAADTKKKSAFDQFMAKMAEGVEEADGRKKGVHPKGHPMRKKQQGAIHAGESVESIKEMLLRKLNAKK